MINLKKKMILWFGIFWGILLICFFNLFSVKRNDIESKKLLKNIIGGVCYNRSCTPREPCGIFLGYLLCSGKNIGDKCAPACEAGYKINHRCDGQPLPANKWCEQSTMSCDKGVSGICMRIGADNTTILVCMPLPFPLRNTILLVAL
ncbi:MAG: hypothetical protein ACK4F0_07990 [Candidatus Ratteibacteria bacterium]